MKKRYERNHTHGDIAIGQIEHRAKKHFTPKQRHPIGECKQWEIKHIYHMPHKPCGVSVAKGAQLCAPHRCRFGKYLSVKSTIYEVANCTGQYHIDDEYEAVAIVMLCKPNDIEYDDYRCHQPEQCKEKLTTQRHTECHAWIFDKTEVEPIEYAITFA